MQNQRRLLFIVGGLLVLGAVLVFVGNVFAQHTNPEVTYTIQWDSPETEALVRAACFDCHSHETTWHWYAYVAPVSFLVVHDVDEGREELNFSTGHNLDLDEMIEEVEAGKMPLPIYLTTHPDARLTDEQQAQLITGLKATFGGASAASGTTENHDNNEDHDEG